MNNFNSDVRIIGEKSNGLQVFVDEDTDDFVTNKCYSDMNQFNFRCYSTSHDNKRDVMLYASRDLGMYSWEGFVMIVMTMKIIGMLTDYINN